MAKTKNFFDNMYIHLDPQKVILIIQWSQKPSEISIGNVIDFLKTACYRGPLEITNMDRHNVEYRQTDGIQNLSLTVNYHNLSKPLILFIKSYPQPTPSTSLQ